MTFVTGNHWAPQHWLLGRPHLLLPRPPQGPTGGEVGGWLPAAQPAGGGLGSTPDPKAPRDLPRHPGRAGGETEAQRGATDPRSQAPSQGAAGGSQGHALLSPCSETGGGRPLTLGLPAHAWSDLAALHPRRVVPAGEGPTADPEAEPRLAQNRVSLPLASQKSWTFQNSELIPW